MWGGGGDFFGYTRFAFGGKLVRGNFHSSVPLVLICDLCRPSRDGILRTQKLKLSSVKKTRPKGSPFKF